MYRLKQTIPYFNSFSVKKKKNKQNFSYYFYEFFRFFLVNEQDEEVFPQEVLDLLMVLRCLRVLRIIASNESFRTIVMTIFNILPSMAIYGTVLLVSFYKNRQFCLSSL